MKKVSANIIPAILLLTLLFQVSALSAADKTPAQWLALAKGGEKKLAGANLSGTSLVNVNLTNADLTNADLSNANLLGADLTGAKLAGAYLYHTNFTGANLTDADLSKAFLLGANMQYANLRSTNLRQALLQEVNLTYAVLFGADLTSSNLLLANLQNADLQNANFTNAYITYDSTGTPISQTVYVNDKEAADAAVASGKLPVPEMVESQALSAALAELEQGKKPFVKLTGAKINANTKGIDHAWCKKNGAVFK